MKARHKEMTKIFTSTKDRVIFAILAILFIAGLTGTFITRTFEKEWYDLEYKDYIKAPDKYTVTDATIKELKTYNGKNDISIRYIDFYYTAIVDVTYENGVVETYRASAGNHEKVGDVIEVAYDKRYDTDYEDMIRGQHHDEGSPYMSIARTQEIRNTKNSTICTAFSCIAGLAAALYLLWCIKKSRELS